MCVFPYLTPPPGLLEPGVVLPFSTTQATLTTSRHQVHRLLFLSIPKIIFINTTIAHLFKSLVTGPWRMCVISTFRRSQIPDLNVLLRYGFWIDSGVTAYKFVVKCDMEVTACPRAPLLQGLMRRASLVVQWLRIRLPMQGTQVRALVQEDPTCRGATKPVRHNYWACALEPTSHNYWSPCA